MHFVTQLHLLRKAIHRALFSPEDFELQINDSFASLSQNFVAFVVLRALSDLIELQCRQPVILPIKNVQFIDRIREVFEQRRIGD